MHITVHCPHCEYRLHLEEDMRGKRMRCPNPLCRAIFEVRTESAKPAAASTAPRPVPSAPAASVVTGSVTELVPLLPAEIAEPPPAPQPAVRTVPRSVPKEPPVPKPAAEPIPSPTAPEPPAFPDDFPGDDTIDGEPVSAEGQQEIGPGTWEAPPVRGVVEEPAPDATTMAPAAEPAGIEGPPPSTHTARRRAALAIAVLVALLGGGAVLVWHAAENIRAGSEAERFKQAQELYEKGDFAEADQTLQKIIKEFPDSRDMRKYRLLAELSSVRGDASDAQALEDRLRALGRVLQFLGINQQEPMVKEYHADIWQTLDRLAEKLAAEADARHDAAALQRARQAAAEADKLEPPSNVNRAARMRELQTRFDQVARSLAAYSERQDLIAAVQEHIERPSAAAVRESRRLVAAAGLHDDPELAGLLKEMVAAHRAAVKYVPVQGSNTQAAIDDDALPGLLVMPYLKQPSRTRTPGGIALALARGVLYAFDAAQGEFRWARRVGIDTTVLPLRVQADPISPELVLVLSSDSKSVSAVVADTGAPVWRHTLPAPCTGQPVLVGRSLLVPTLSGRIDEVEISEGRLLGYYDLGQRLTVGGARQADTSLVYFPGDEFCVYVLDVAKRTCAAVLYSNHPAGSLRGVPILVRGRSAAKAKQPGKGPSGWLLLCQARRTDAVEVRPFALPISDPDQAPLHLEEPLQVPGLSWFPPYHDADKLALATDAGLLSLWGIRQKGNPGDPLLFRLLKNDYPAGGGSGRAQVVHADADAYWVSSGGRLHRLNSVLRPESGPDLLAAWPQPPSLGSPLHMAQHFSDARGRTTLLLTTLAPDRPACLCTAVHAASGHFAWQRQLGCTPQRAPVAVDGRVLLRDATGLLLLDPTEVAGGKAWQTVNSLLDAADHADTLGASDGTILLPAAGEFVQLTWAIIGDKTSLRVRHVPLSGAGATERYNLAAPPAGTAALGTGSVLLPLANGVAVRLDFKGTFVAGPNWRAPGADEESLGHVVAVGGDDFLLTDGGRGLIRVSWPGKLFQQRAATEVGARIIAPPAVLPSAAGLPPRICVADAADALTLLDGERLQTLRAIPLGGKITMGPLVRGSAIVCVLDHRRVVSLEPEGGDAREYVMDADVVGEPVLVDGVLVAADVSGRFVALNPRTCEPLGAGYRMRANIAPETAPVPFGHGRLLVPLNDGTLLLLPLDKLR